MLVPFAFYFAESPLMPIPRCRDLQSYHQYFSVTVQFWVWSEYVVPYRISLADLKGFSAVMPANVCYFWPEPPSFWLVFSCWIGDRDCSLCEIKTMLAATFSNHFELLVVNFHEQEGTVHHTILSSCWVRSASLPLCVRYFFTSTHYSPLKYRFNSAMSLW